MNKITENIKKDIFTVSKELLIYSLLAVLTIFILVGIAGVATAFSSAGIALLITLILGFAEIVFLFKIYFKYGNKILQSILSYDEDYIGYNYTKNLLVVILLGIVLAFISIILAGVSGILGLIISLLIYFIGIYISIHFILEKRNIKFKQFITIGLYNLVFVILFTLIFIGLLILLVAFSFAIGMISAILGLIIFCIGMVGLSLGIVSAQLIIRLRILLFFTKINEREIVLAQKIDSSETEDSVTDEDKEDKELKD